MTRKQTMRLLTMLLVCIILLNFISQPKAEAIGGSLALALGGTSAAKAFLAFIMSCIAMGVTYSTYDQAKAAYDHYIENSTLSTEDLRYIQQETWTGNYEGITSDISDMKDAFVGWLTAIFGTIQTGLNQVSSIEDAEFINGFYVRYVTNNSANWAGSYIVNYGGVIVKAEVTYNKMLYTHHYKMVIDNNITTYFYGDNTHIKYNPTTKGFGVGTLTTFAPLAYINTPIEYPNNPSISANITTDAPILNPAYTPQNRTFPAAPYLPYIDFDNEKVGQSISASGGTMEVYNGTYDQYLDDIVENATWEDIQGISAGTVPTTTLTETSEGLIIGEATAGIPYPNPDTTAPGEVLSGLGGIMGLLQGITNWIAQLWQLISGIFAIPEGLALDFSSLRLEGFKDKFPFSIPWDIYRAVAVFAKTPETPEFNIDIETDYLDINHSINLDPIDLPLRFARYVMSIFFIFFLASKTRDLIKW